MPHVDIDQSRLSSIENHDLLQHPWHFCLHWFNRVPFEVGEAGLKHLVRDRSSRDETVAIETLFE